jgi:starch-binding outer membrane protein, SusD/RagB family
MTTYMKGRGRWPLLRASALGAGLLVALAACDVDSMMEIDDPEFPGAGQIPIASIAGGATVEFMRAWGGVASNLHDEGMITVGAAISDEFIAAGTFTTRIAIDQRDPQAPSQGNITDAAFRWLHRARRAARDATAELVAEGITTGTEAARLHGLEGYAWVGLGEIFCGAVPISNVEDGQFVGGPMHTTTQLFEGAVERFNRALAAQSTFHMAAVGKGRALLNLGRFADAAAAVSGVPTSFIYFLEHSDNASIQRNNISALSDNGRWSMSDNEGVNGLPFRSSGDPRVPWRPRGPGFDPLVPLFVSERYMVTTSTSTNNAANVVLADGIEARLIQAEAALHAGGDWLGPLNALRADFESLMAARYGNYAANLATGVAAGRLNPTLPPLTDPGSAAARQDLILEERAYWLFLTGHRQGDLRRFMRAPYNRAANTLFPIGAHHLSSGAGAYQNAVSFPLPLDEEGNNPNYDPAACDITR